LNIEPKIKQSKELIEWLDKNINGIEIADENRQRLSVGCLDVALEHQKGIIVLIENNVIGSALSLVRVIFESYIRGVWLNQCATDKELKLFVKDKLEKSFAILVSEIESKETFNAGILSNARKSGWGAMNSYTHSGIQQIVRRNTETSITPNYSEGEIVEAINFTNAIALLSAIEICNISNHIKLANELLEKVKEIASV